MTTEDYIEAYGTAKEDIAITVGALTVLNLEEDEYWVRETIENLTCTHRNLGRHVDALRVRLRTEESPKDEPAPAKAEVSEGEVPF